METREATAYYRLSRWAEIMQERVNSGESVEDFCIRKGIGKHKYYYWQQKLRKVAGEQLSSQSPKASGISVRGFAEVRLAEPPTNHLVTESNQICIETVSYRITAGSAYPAESLAVVLRETLKP